MQQNLGLYRLYTEIACLEYLDENPNAEIVDSFAGFIDTNNIKVTIKIKPDKKINKTINLIKKYKL